MSAAGVRAGRAYVEVGTDEGPLDAGLRRVQARLQAFGKRMALVGAGMTAASAAITGPISFAVKQSIDSGSQLVAMNQKTGASIESLSELRYAAAQADVSFESLGNGIKFQQKNLAAAIQGNDAAVEAFENIGLSASDLIRMQPDQAFERIADAIASLPDPSMRTAAAMAIFGRSGSDLLPMFADGARGIRMMRDEAKALGLQVKTADSIEAEKLGDNLNTLWLVIRDIGEEVANAINPMLNQLLKRIIPIVVGVASWISQNRQLVAVLTIVAVAIGVAGAAITAIGFAAMGASAGLGLLSTAFGVLGSMVGLLNPVVGLVLLIGGVLAIAAWAFQKEWLKAFANIKAAAQHLWVDIRRSWVADPWEWIQFKVEQSIGGWATLGMTQDQAEQFRKALFEDQAIRSQERKNGNGAGSHAQIDAELRARHAEIERQFAEQDKKQEEQLGAKDKEVKAAEEQARLAQEEFERKQAKFLADIEAATAAEEEAKSGRQRSVEKAKQTVSATGTFSAAEAFRMSGQGFSIQHKIASATERTARNTEKLKDARPLVITP